MPFITREDGERFVIPSYRDVLSSKQKSVLKKDILILSQSYGEYITLQRKNAVQYEVAFSPEPGYLLGESIWHYFKRPIDMIYCEAIPNTSEAILVIVKSGSVYLDGSFPLESIPEELVIFLTQQNNFEIYIYGDVPIGKTPEEGKFSFEASSISSFNVLEKPVFPMLPLYRMYQLRLVEQVLKEQGIGVFPTRQVVTILVVLGVGYMLYDYFTAPKEVPEQAATQDVFQGYLDTLQSPAPYDEVAALTEKLALFYSMPGWIVKDFKYSSGNITANVFSAGNSVESLLAWGAQNKVNINIKKDGISLSAMLAPAKRPAPKNIYPIKEVIAKLVDEINTVYPGDHLTLSEFANRGRYTDVVVNLKFDAISPDLFVLIIKQLNDLPLSVKDVTATVKNGSISGSINLDALGS